MKCKWLVFALSVLIFSPIAARAQQPPDSGKTTPRAFQPPSAAKDLDRSKIFGQPPDLLTEKPIDQHPVGQAPIAVLQQPGETRRWTSIEIVLSFSVLVFGAMVFALQTWLVVKMPLNWTPNAILRFNGLTLIITGAILLVTAGYSNEQMTPVIGLLGAIAGYLLGSVEKPDEKRPEARQSSDERRHSSTDADQAK
ncbi:hypothetical protein GC170_15125 [bacterium]|nr:hypothetical protein [bacterium]